MGTMKRRPTRLYFDEDIWTWLQKEAARLRCSVSQVVRNLVLARMERKKP